jgi:hypothetical protein
MNNLTQMVGVKGKIVLCVGPESAAGFPRSERPARCARYP